MTGSSFLSERQVRCALGFRALEPSTLALVVAVASSYQRQGERLVVTDDNGAHRPIEELVGVDGTRTHIVRLEPGPFHVAYEATVPAGPSGATHSDDPRSNPADEATLVALRQSRYCPSDRVEGFARSIGELDRPLSETAHLLADWVFEHLAYEPGWSGPADGALETLSSLRGVCRDFAHLTISMCRARGIPARMVSAYAPGLTPMDFHAVVEVRTENGWEILDPSRLAPRSSLVRIAIGRDAADTAFATTLWGDVALDSAEVVAVIDGDLPADDHVTPVHLN